VPVPPPEPDATLEFALPVPLGAPAELPPEPVEDAVVDDVDDVDDTDDVDGE
jgi:hypothetical protein